MESVPFPTIDKEIKFSTTSSDPRNMSKTKIHI